MLDSLVSRQQTQQRSWWKQLLQSSARIKLVDAEKNTTVKNRTQDRDRLQKAPALFTLTAGKTRNKQKKQTNSKRIVYNIYRSCYFYCREKNKDTEDSMQMQWTPSAALRGTVENRENKIDCVHLTVTWKPKMVL